MPTAPPRFKIESHKPIKPLIDTRAGFRGQRRYDAKRRIYERDRCRCQMCQAFVLLTESQLDHITPIAHGGGHDDGNLRTLCLNCHTGRRG